MLKFWYLFSKKLSLEKSPEKEEIRELNKKNNLAIKEKINKVEIKFNERNTLKD